MKIGDLVMIRQDVDEYTAVMGDTIGVIIDEKWDDEDREAVNKIKLFKTLQIDGDQKYLDLLSESFLTESELKNFDYSDTMARFKITSLLKERLGKDISMVFWKRVWY